MKAILRAGISVGLLVALFVFLPWGEVSGAIGRADLPTWTLALAGFLAGHLLGSVKWRLLVNASGGMLSVRDAIMCYAAGLFANLCLPTIVGGDVLRAALASKRGRSPQGALWGSVVDRASDLIATAMLVAIGLLLSKQELPGVWRLIAVTGGAMMAAVAFGLLIPVVLRVPLGRWPKVLRRPVSRTLVTLRRSARNPLALAMALAASLTIQSSFTLLGALLGMSIGINIALGAWFLAWPLAKIAGLLPISLGGLAVREAALASMLLPFGVALADGVIASLLWQSVLIAGGLLAGALWRIMARQDGAPLSLRAAVADIESRQQHA